MSRSHPSIALSAAASITSLLVGCWPSAPEGPKSAVLIVAPEEADAATERTITALEAYFEAIAGEPPQVVRLGEVGYDQIVAASASVGAAVTLALEAETLAPERFDQARMDALDEYGFALDVADEGAHSDVFGEQGTTVMLAAGTGRLARQYAAYEALRRLEARFYHPEEEYVPRVPDEQLRERARTPTALHREGSDYLPDFHWRSWSFHSSHPLEHLEAFSDGGFPIDEAERVNDWQVKNKGNRFRGAGRGVASAEATQKRIGELAALQDLLGFPHTGGIELHNVQQGGKPDIDPNSPVPVKQQIDDLVAKAFAATTDLRTFGIHFGPTELTVTPDQETVQWINWAGEAVLARDPKVEIEINNHITGSQPSPNYDDLGCPNGTNADGRIDYYDLAFRTDPGLGISVHTVMFYPLAGPAEVYGQHSFAHKLCLMTKAAAAKRPLTWFPEGAWWLSFDNPIPVYLPLYIWARHRDFELLQPLLARKGGTLRGHRQFNSGQEWGYWQQDYTAGLSAWNTDVTLEQGLGELYDPLCPPEAWPKSCAARDEAIAVTEELIDHQRAIFLDGVDWEGRAGGLYAYFAGEDDADVIAANTGISFRPVRVAFNKILGWSADDIALLRGSDLKALSESADMHAEWLARLTALQSTVPEAGAPWLAEVIDGVAINELRARQTVHLYEAVLKYREAVLASDPDPAKAADAEWKAAQDVLKQAEAVIRRREAAYRYPAAQEFGGGLTPETAVPNGTTYPYRVHTRTHLLSYWNNRNDLVKSVLDGTAGGESAVVDMREAIAAPGEALTIQWGDVPGLSGSLSIGDLGMVDPTVGSFDLGSEEGYYAVSGNLTVDNQPLPISGGLVRSSRRAGSSAGKLTVTTPADPTIQGMIEGVFPAVLWAYVGAGADAPALAFATDPQEDGSASFEEVVLSHVDLAGSAFTGEPVEFIVPVATSAGGLPIVVHVSNTVFSGSVDGTGFTAPIGLAGDLSVPDFVVALEELGGFDEAGALDFLAMFLGFDAADPPPTIPVVAEITLDP